MAIEKTGVRLASSIHPKREIEMTEVWRGRPEKLRTAVPAGARGNRRIGENETAGCRV